MIYDQHVAIVVVLLRPDEFQSIVKQNLFLSLNNYLFRMFIHKKLVMNLNFHHLQLHYSVQKVQIN